MARAQDVVKFTNCQLAIDDQLVWRDLWISRSSGKILDPQSAFFDNHASPAEIFNLGGKILAPGLIDTQLNGGFGFDFSVPRESYGDKLDIVNRKLVETGVTSYLPTLTSQKSEVYPKTVPFLAAPTTRLAENGAESLGVHCEGPFINPERNGIHKKEVLQIPKNIAALEACYGTEHLQPLASNSPVVKMVTIATELDESETVIRELRSRGILVSIGHSTATLSQMSKAVKLGATMITHLFNAMSQPHHRNPGIFGVLTNQPEMKRPWFGIIADDIHVHPNMVSMAYKAHPDGCILVTDAMSVLGLEDGDYPWTNGETIEKKGGKVTLKGTDGTIAGSCVTLLECVTNLVRWTNIPIATAIKTVTLTPAKMLGVEDRKGTLKPGADADLVVLSRGEDANGEVTLSLHQVWKYGVCVHSKASGTIKPRL